MCQLGILIRPAIHLAAVNRVVLALSQFVDSLGSALFGSVRIDSARLDSSNQIRSAAIRMAPNPRSIPDRDETVVLKFRLLN